MNNCHLLKVAVAEHMVKRGRRGQGCMCQNFVHLLFVFLLQPETNDASTVRWVLGIAFGNGWQWIKRMPACKRQIQPLTSICEGQSTPSGASTQSIMIIWRADILNAFPAEVWHRHIFKQQITTSSNSTNSQTKLHTILLVPSIVCLSKRRGLINCSNVKCEVYSLYNS